MSDNYPEDEEAGPMRSSLLKRTMLAAVAPIATLIFSDPAQAVPAFAEQTRQPCAACHVGAFGPQLTPFGRDFKMKGYTLKAGDSFTNPVSVMAIVSYVNSSRDLPAPPAPHYGTNNNTTLDQASLFLAGGIGDHFGGFTQWTYDGVGRAFAWDNLDIRAVFDAKWFGSDVTAGFSLNNAPGVQDTWNTLPAWGFAYTGSDLVPAPGAGTLLDGGLAQTVLGLTAYAMWDDTFYTEAGFYWTPSHGFLRFFGADASGGAGAISSAAPYIRVAYQKNYGAQNFEVGAFALIANLYPGGDTSTGTTDTLADIGLDASYQYLGDGEDIYTVNARYTHERQRLAASVALGNAANLSNSLNDARLDVSYTWQNILSGTVQVFNTWGSVDPLLYGGNTALRPDSSGFVLEVDGTLFGHDMDLLDGRFNLRVGAQYTVYTRFDGSSSNYDGSGRNASDNNTLRLFVWTAL